MVSRDGNFTVYFRYIEGVKRTAKRVDVSEKTLSRPNSREAWQLVQKIVKLASSKPGVALVSLEVYEGKKRVWKEL